MAGKINVKERLTNGEIDLSMSDLEDVPLNQLKEIIQQKKAYSLDLSNNRLTLLPKAFPNLTNLTKLDLSKNELKELPENFGNLSKLKHLDLYRNQLQHLPLSFSKLKDLRWMDLKDNPLVPAVAKVAGSCLDTKQCQSCAKDVVNFFVKIEQQVSADLEARNKTRQKQLEINQKKQQEEKRVKKKEKQKLKQEVPIVQKNGVGVAKVKAKKDSNNKKNKAVPVKEESGGSVWKKLILLSFLTALALFLSTSVKLKYTENVDMLTRDAYHVVLDKVPKDFRDYGVQFGNIFEEFHNRTGQIVLGAVRYVNDTIPPSKREQLYEDFRNILYSFVQRIKAIYNHFSSG